jgi:hypothetical protein
MILLLLQGLVELIGQINGSQDRQLHGGRISHLRGQRVHPLINAPPELSDIAFFRVATDRVPTPIDLNLESLAH